VPAMNLSAIVALNAPFDEIDAACVDCTCRRACVRQYRSGIEEEKRTVTDFPLPDTRRAMFPAACVGTRWPSPLTPDEGVLPSYVFPFSGAASALAVAPSASATVMARVRCDQFVMIPSGVAFSATTITRSVTQQNLARAVSTCAGSHCRERDLAMSSAGPRRGGLPLSSAARCWAPLKPAAERCREVWRGVESSSGGSAGSVGKVAM